MAIGYWPLTAGLSNVAMTILLHLPPIFQICSEAEVYTFEVVVWDPPDLTTDFSLRPGERMLVTSESFIIFFVVVRNVLH